MFNINEWEIANEILIPKSAPASQIQGIFFNSYTGAGPKMDVWETVSLSSVVHPRTKAIHLTGILIITHGSNAELADLTVYFRKDSSLPSNQNHQCIETETGGGQRSTMACWVPLTEKLTFDWKWHVKIDNGSWPIWSAYGANLQIDCIGINNQ